MNPGMHMDAGTMGMSEAHAVPRPGTKEQVTHVPVEQQAVQSERRAWEPPAITEISLRS